MPDLVFIIKTPAELEGAKAAAAQIEFNIGKFKALGKETAELEERFQTVTASIEAYTAANAQTTAAVDQTTEAVKRQKEETISAAQYTQDSLNPAVAEYSQTVEEAGEKTEVTAKSLRGLEFASTVLGASFGTLRRVWHLATNPIAIAITGIVGSFALWNYRVKELTASLARLEMPDVTDDQIAKIKAGAEELGKFATQLIANSDAEDQLKESTNRRLAEVDRELALTKQLIEAQKALALLTDQTPEGKAATEAEAAEQTRKAEDAAADAKFQALLDQQTELRKIGEGKIAAAGKVAPKSSETKIAIDYEAAAARGFEVLREVEQARGDIAELADAKGIIGFFQSLGANIRLLKRYQGVMTSDEQREVEKQNVESAKNAIAQYTQFGKAAAAREAKRGQREQGEKDIKEAEGMVPTLRDEAYANYRRKETEKELQRLNEAARGIRADQEAEEIRKRQEKQAAAERKALGREAKAGLEADVKTGKDFSGTFDAEAANVTAAVATALETQAAQFKATLNQMAKDIADLGSRTQNGQV